MPAPNVGRVPEWTVSDRLRKAREAAELEQKELSEVSGISRSTISAVENGKRPSRATVRLWAMATGVPLEWIERGDDFLVHPLGLEPRTHCFREGALAEVTPIGEARSSRMLAITAGKTA